MRRFAFQELAYAIVVAAAYGLIIGIYVTSVIDLVIIEALPLYIILWVLFICMHLGGIFLLVKLEEMQENTQKSKTSSENEQK
ncbi:MAG: hypothetical protein JSW11_14030 [Candidatus Heimdallarchaeota archaeon]|nr:MAG: hypothetical protein JSW11_14030 [Candidatus Heimdallarchaeota archaeon]